MAIELPTGDPTLMAIDVAIEEKENRQKRRGYYGTHDVGEECELASWLNFRWASVVRFDADTLKKFADGHLGEDVQAERIRLVDGVDLQTVDPATGEQFGFVDCDGHMGGHCDGIVYGLLQAPKTKHIWEHKQTSDKVQKALAKAIAENGQADALKVWNIKYYAQAQVYMHQFKAKRHWLTCANAGGRKTISVRTHYNKDDALFYLERAKRIIKTAAPNNLLRIATDPTFYKCKWCNHSDVCYGNQFPQANCRTCAHVTPVENGQWHCDKWDSIIPTADDQAAGCEHHLFIPDLVPYELTDTDDDNTFVEYQTPQGKFKNGYEYIQSQDLAATGLAAIELTPIKKSSTGE